MGGVFFKRLTKKVTIVVTNQKYRKIFEKA